MARLPNPGGDADIWGKVLNEFLLVSLNSDGTLRDPGVSTSQFNSHVSSNDPHAAASYAIMIGGGRRIYVQDTQPTGMQEGDIWIDTSGI